MHVRNSRTSWWSLRILVIFRVGMCWIHQALCACYCQSYQAVLETNGLEMSWLYAEGTKGNQIWQISSILSMMRHLLSVIQSFQKRELSNIVIKSQIAEVLKFHHLLQRMMAKWWHMFKKDHQIASIVVKIIYWIGAMYLWTKHWRKGSSF